MAKGHEVAEKNKSLLLYIFAECVFIEVNK